MKTTKKTRLTRTIGIVTVVTAFGVAGVLTLGLAWWMVPVAVVAAVAMSR